MNHTVRTAVSHTLDPLDWKGFEQQYWEQEPLHIERNDAAHFADLLRMEQLESLLSTRQLQFPDVQLTRQPDSPAVDAYTDDQRSIVPFRLIEQYRQGATIVLSGAHRQIGSLMRFRRSMQAETGLRCQANLYLTPPSAQGFGPHYDSHDVFILQVQGSKTFHFHEGGVLLPYAHESFDKQQHRAGAVTESISLQAGDTLYIPRGVMHDAVAGDTASLHVTLGVHAITRREILIDMIEHMSAQDPAYRRSLPAGKWVSGASSDGQDSLSHGHAEADQLTDELRAQLLEIRLAEEHWQQARERLLSEVALQNSQDCSGMLTARGNAIPASVGIRLDPQCLLSSQWCGERLVCRVPGQVLEFEGPWALAVDQLLRGHTSRSDEWSGLTEQQQQSLFSRLLQAGIVLPA